MCWGNGIPAASFWIELRFPAFNIAWWTQKIKKNKIKLIESLKRFLKETNKHLPAETSIEQWPKVNTGYSIVALVMLVLLLEELIP